MLTVCTFMLHNMPAKYEFPQYHPPIVQAMMRELEGHIGGLGWMVVMGENLGSREGARHYGGARTIWFQALLNDTKLELVQSEGSILLS